MRTTMTGSWPRPPEIADLLRRSPTGEIPLSHRNEIEASERRAIRDQLHPAGSPLGLYWASNGEQRKAGYVAYLPNRFHGFSSEKTPVKRSPAFLEEIKESNPELYAKRFASQAARTLQLPRIVSRLEYHGEELARRETEDAVRLAREEGAPRIFIPSPSPGVTTLFFSRTDVYRDHLDYLYEMSRQLRREYRAILEVEGADLQIDAPDLAMGKHMATEWGADFYRVLPDHIDAINEAVAGSPKERIRAHYCYGNYLGSHVNDAEFGKLLPELLRLKVGTLVGEYANPRHEGDVLILEEYLKEHDWPEGLNLAAGVIDVKSPSVETPETVSVRLDRFARIEKLDPDHLLGGTDCGFETFAELSNVPHSIALRKLQSLVRGAELESRRLGLA